ncbi:siroheme synthase-like [Phoenix dactylifera]|uniref:uroporphyrinogen-III C-methyltransferase n=1 Tax=Phoenix dactylifera TaxID=42345 RepID=A0A8B7BVA5_PHODC|nr:siroheme synthase-like [Phoenix dactylifera]
MALAAASSSCSPARNLTHVSSSSSPSLPSSKPSPLSPFFPCRQSQRVVSCSAAASPSSPFTEKDSAERYRRDGWVYGSGVPLPVSAHQNFSDRENEIALQLPELKRLLEALRAARRAEVGGGGGRSGPGSVSLVGTGPGDPELLTLKAVRAIEQADLVLYDRLVSNDVLGFVRADAKMLYVGKTAGYHSRTQEEIHELLLSFAEAGANVVRLKGGDPLVFGRGGEEMDFLQKQGIQVKVIPGITSASGIAAELGIPLTHRGVANSVRFLTGHSRNGGMDPLYVEENAADPDSTLVVYMGLSTLQALASKLMNHGLPPDTPAVAVERGTTPQQRMVFAELKDIVYEVKLADLVSPTLIIIGRVVALSPLWPQSSEETVVLKTGRLCCSQIE